MTGVPDPRPLEALDPMPAEIGKWLYGKWLSGELAPLGDGRIPIAVPGGVATLGPDGKLLESQRPPAGGSGGGGFVPTYIGEGESFTVPENTQALFVRPIVVDDGGTLVVDGELIAISLT